MKIIKILTKTEASNSDLNANEALEVNNKRKTDSNDNLNENEALVVNKKPKTESNDNQVSLTSPPWEAKMEEARMLMIEEIPRLRNEVLKWKNVAENKEQEMKTAVATVNKFGKHFGLPDGASLWNHMMEKAAEYEAKENELGELRQKENKAQQQIQILEEEKANLIDKNKTETTKKDQASFAFIAKLKDDFCKKDAELRTTQTALKEEKIKKEKILINAKRKILQLNQDLTAARADAGKPNEDGKILFFVIPK